MHLPKYSLFYDFHTSMDYPDIGCNFNAEEFTDRLVECGVDYLTFHARCNMGLAYYNTKIGIRHPGLNFDMFGQLAEACQRKNIALTAYLNAGISQAEWLQHREWGSINFDGQSYRGYRISPVVRTMCCNTPYRDHLIAMMKEIAANYPVAGFFLDCMSDFPCICPTCVAEMKKLGIDWRKEEEVTAFAHRSMIRLARDISREMRSINPDFLLYFNPVDFEDQSDSCTHFECECIPSLPSWSYEYLPVLSHYMRTLGKPCLNMTGRFFHWGDFGSIRPATAVKSELLYGLANGLRPNIGDHFLPHGELNHAVLDEVRDIYQELQTMEPWFEQAVPKAEIGVVFPRNIIHIRFDQELRGVVRMLSELKQQFDIVSLTGSWDSYNLLIFPDSIVFDQEITDRVRKHLAAGKKIIASGYSGLDPDRREFVLPEAWGVRCLGDCQWSPIYFKAEDGVKEGLPECPLAIYADGICMSPLPNTEIKAGLIRPRFNHDWDGENANFYNPPETELETPFLTMTAQVAHFSHRLFTGYKHQAAIHLRRIFQNVLQHMLPSPMLKFEHAPSFLRAFVTGQKNRSMIHLLAYIPEQRGEESFVIEDELQISDLKIALRLEDGQQPSEVYVIPDHRNLKFSVREKYVSFELPEMTGNAIIAVEFRQTDDEHKA